MMKKHDPKLFSAICQELQKSFLSKRPSFQIVERIVFHLTNLTKYFRTHTPPPKNAFVQIETILLSKLLKRSIFSEIYALMEAYAKCLKTMYSFNPTHIDPMFRKLVKLLLSHSKKKSKSSEDERYVSFGLKIISTLLEIRGLSVDILMNLIPKLWKVGGPSIRRSVLSVLEKIVIHLQPKHEKELFLIFRILAKELPYHASRCHLVVHRIIYKKNIALERPKVFTHLQQLCVNGLESEPRFGSLLSDLLRRVIPKSQSVTFDSSLNYLIKQLKTQSITPGNYYSSQPGIISSYFFGESSKRGGGGRRRQYQPLSKHGIVVALSDFLSSINYNSQDDSKFSGSLKRIVDKFLSLFTSSNGSSTSSSSDKKQLKRLQFELAYSIYRIIHKGIIVQCSEQKRLILLRTFIDCLLKQISVEINPFLSFKEQLALRQNSSRNTSPAMLICMLRLISNLCELLGDLMIREKSRLIETIMRCLENQNEYVRLIGMLCLRTFGSTSPNELTRLTGSLLTMVQMDHVEMIEESSLSKSCKMSGHVNALASLIALSSQHPMSTSYVLCSSTLDTAHLLLEYTSKKGNSSSSSKQQKNKRENILKQDKKKSVFGKRRNMNSHEIMIRRKCACVLISSLLLLNEYWIELKIDRIFEVWDSMMDDELHNLPRKMPDFGFHVRSFAYALFSMTVFLRRHKLKKKELFLSEDRQFSSSKRRRRVLLTSAEKKDLSLLEIFMKYIGNTLRVIQYFYDSRDGLHEDHGNNNKEEEEEDSIVSSLSRDFVDLKSDFEAEQSINILQTYLFQLVSELPRKLLLKYPKIVKSVTKLCFMNSLGWNKTTSTSTTTTTTTTTLLSNLVRMEEEKMRDEDMIRENKVRFTLPREMNPDLILCPTKVTEASYTESMDVQLVNSSILCLSRLFHCQKSVSAQARLIDHFVAQIQQAMYSNSNETKKLVFSNVLALLHYLLKILVEDYYYHHDSTNKNNNKKQQQQQKQQQLPKYLQKIHSILGATLGNEDPTIRLSGAKILANLARLIGEPVLRKLIHQVAGKVMTTRPGPITSGYAMALGQVNIHLARPLLGSHTVFGSNSHLASTVSFLIALSRSEDPMTQKSALRSLGDTIDASGIQITPHIDAILQNIGMIMFSPPAPSIDDKSKKSRKKKKKKDDSSNTESSNSSNSSKKQIQTMVDLQKQHIFNLVGFSRILHNCVNLGGEVVRKREFRSLFQLVMDMGLSLDDRSGGNAVIEVQRQSIQMIQKSSIILPELILPQLESKTIPRLSQLIKHPNKLLRKQATACLESLAGVHPKKVASQKLFHPNELLLTGGGSSSSSQYPPSLSFIRTSLFSYIDYEIFPPEKWIEICNDVVFNHPEVEWRKKRLCVLILHKIVNRAHQRNTLEDLIEYIPNIVKICAYVVTSQGDLVLPKSQRAGVACLSSLIEYYGRAKARGGEEDELLLESEVMNIGRVVGNGMDVQKSHPCCIFETSDLLVHYIDSGLLRNDPQALKRMMSHLYNYLPNLSSLQFHQYGEVASTLVRLSILSALARIVILYPDSFFDEDRIPEFKEKYSSIILNYWSKCLQDYAQLDFTGEMDEEGRTFKCVLGSDRIPRTFYAEGTEKAVRPFFQTTFAEILNALTIVSCSVGILNDPTLLLGLAVRGMALYGSAGDSQGGGGKEEKGSKEDNNGKEEKEDCRKFSRVNLLENCLDSLVRIIETKQYLGLSNVDDLTVQIIHLVSSAQKSFVSSGFQERVVDFVWIVLKQGAVLRKINESDLVPLEKIRECQNLFDILIRSFRVLFPSFFIEQQQQQQQHQFSFSNKQKEVLRKGLECFELYLRRLGRTGWAGRQGGRKVFTALGFVCYQSCVKADEPKCLSVLSDWIKKKMKSPATFIHTEGGDLKKTSQKEEEEEEMNSEEVWNEVFFRIINDIIGRIEVFSSSNNDNSKMMISNLQIEFLFISISAYIISTSSSPSSKTTKLEDYEIHHNISSKIINFITSRIKQQPKKTTTKTEHIIEELKEFLVGFQHGILYCAQIGFSELSNFYLSQINPYLILVLKYIQKEEIKNTKLILEVIEVIMNVFLFFVELNVVSHEEEEEEEGEGESSDVTKKQILELFFGVAMIVEDVSVELKDDDSVIGSKLKSLCQKSLRRVVCKYFGYQSYEKNDNVVEVERLVEEVFDYHINSIRIKDLLKMKMLDEEEEEEDGDKKKKRKKRKKRKKKKKKRKMKIDF